MVAEHFCSVCATPFLNGAPLDDEGRCGMCRRGVTGFDSAFSYGEYDGTLRTLIHLLKYDGIRPLERPLGRLLSKALPRSGRYDAVVPVPLHWRRRLSRGFNQSELLARRVAERLNVPVTNALRRSRSTRAQAGLTSAQRRDNVSGAFRVADRRLVDGKEVLLVDDVLTTGATLNAAAAVLKRAGARRVTILTLARADRRHSAVSTSPSRELSA